MGFEELFNSIIKRGMPTPEEKAKELGVPLIPKLPEPTPVPPNNVVAVCGECGRSVYRIDSYACTITQCPLKVR